MSNNIKLHQKDLPEDLDLGNVLAVDGEFMGLNVRRDPLCLILASGYRSFSNHKNAESLAYAKLFPTKYWWTHPLSGLC